MLILQELAPYQPALLALLVLIVAVLVQALLTAPLAFVSAGQVPGAPLSGSHDQLGFRVIRTHANSAENMAPFGLALLVAIVVGVGSDLVNWCAGVHVMFRLFFWALYYAGVGKVAGGPRSLCFLGGLIANVVLAGSAIVVFV